MQKFTVQITTHYQDPRQCPLNALVGNGSFNQIVQQDFIQALLNISDQKEPVTIEVSLAPAESGSIARKTAAKPPPVRQKAGAAKLPTLADVKTWTLTKFPWNAEIERINKEVFKNSSFRPNQRAIINATMRGKISTSTGSSPIVDNASISSRIFMEPISAV